VKQISILPRHTAIALSTEYPMERLKAHSSPQFFAQSQDLSVLERLEQSYDSEAAVTQYVLVEEKTEDEIPVILRLKEDSLSLLEEVYVSMRWLILDWDLPSKGTLWGDPSKPETKDQLKAYISEHPKLKYAYAYYFSKTGLRVMFALSNPLRLVDSTDVVRWKRAYDAFIKALDVSEIGGKFDSKSDPFTLNRVPNYNLDGTQYTGEIVAQNTKRPIKLKYPERVQIEAQAAARQQTKQYDNTLPPQDLAGECLSQDPLITYLRESNHQLSYSDWRAIGTNVAALFGADFGLVVFNDISQWDTQNYNPGAVKSQWPHMVKSAEDYGPTTWGQFEMDVDAIYGTSMAEKSSLAARVRRTISEIQSPSPGNSPASNSGFVDNFDEVYQNLKMLTKVRGDSVVQTPEKSPTNLVTILELDNRWRGKIWRNHLGSIDMLGDRPISDEDITSIREIISRIYNLSYSKDDCWDFVKFIASSNEHNPVADYLNALKWDGQDRIGGLAAALGQTDPFAVTILKKFLVSCIIRPLEWDNHGNHINWKVDTVLILKGAQGKRKSSFFKALCQNEEWFSDNLPSITHERKDASLHMLGKWIVEQAEFEGHVARSSVEMMKAFITREREIFRKPYGRAEINMRRPSILVGTTNSSSFLNDPTGDRRFWVLEIPEEHHIQLGWVKQSRDQLWAQAVELYKAGEDWWLTDAETTQSNAQNRKFRRPDPLEEAVRDYLNTTPMMSTLGQDSRYEDGIGFTWKQFVTMGLDKKLADLKSHQCQSIIQTLAKLGYVKVRVRINGTRMYVFRKLKEFKDEDDH